MSPYRSVLPTEIATEEKDLWYLLQGGGGGGETNWMITVEAGHGNITWFVILLSLLLHMLEISTTKLKKKECNKRMENTSQKLRKDICNLSAYRD